MRADHDIDHALLATVIDMGKRGFSIEFIERTTGLSKGQVSYRLHQFDVHVYDYRRGKTPEAEAAVAKTPCVRQHIKATAGQVYRVAQYRTSTEA